MTPFSLPLTLTDFLRTYILGVIGLVALSWGLTVFADFELPSSVAVVPFVIAVQIAAQRHVARGGGRIGGRAAWGAALAMTLAAMAVAAALAGVLTLVLGLEALLGPVATESYSLEVWASVALFVVVVHSALARICLGWMVRLALRNAELEK